MTTLRGYYKRMMNFKPGMADGSAGSLACLAVVIKTLVDKGIITDADLQATIDASTPDQYDP